MSGSVVVDGSSTVFPLTSAAAELFNEEQPDVQVSVGTSGTGGGFEKFCAGETDISDASRLIDEEETAACETEGIEFAQLDVANDALTVVVNKDNDWVDCLTVEQLAAMWGRLQREVLEGHRPVVSERAAGLVRSRHRLRHVRLLHRRDQR